MNGTRPVPPRPVRVVLIAGAGRSGSTLLTLMLGSLPGAFAVGELRYLWARGLVERRLCGCGQPVPDCEVWSEILETAFTALAPDDIGRAIDAVNWLGNIANVPRILRRGPHGRFPELGDLPARLGDLYRSIGEVTGATTIVDSSKPPTYGWLLATLPNIDLRVIHLVRDPRGTAYSWQRAKAAVDRSTGGLMPRKPPWKSALTWDLWNTTTELLFRGQPERRLRLRYEDLIAHPAATMSSVLAFLGSSEDALASLAGQWFTPGTAHTVAGNPSRMAGQPMKLELDTAWRAHLSVTARRTVTTLSAPLLHHYGYPFRHPADAPTIDLNEPHEVTVPRPVHTDSQRSTGHASLRS